MSLTYDCYAGGNSYCYYDYLFCLALAGNNESFRWHPPNLVNNTDTQYLGDQHWQQCWFVRFFFFLVSIYFCMCQSVCVSVHLFTINLKFSKTHNYWLAQPELEKLSFLVHESPCLYSTTKLWETSGLVV